MKYNLREYISVPMRETSSESNQNRLRYDIFSLLKKPKNVYLFMKIFSSKGKKKKKFKGKLFPNLEMRSELSNPQIYSYFLRSTGHMTFRNHY